MTRVSIVSVFYNRAAKVEETVACLLAQTHGDTEIILVDDGSTDNTLAEMHRCAEGTAIRVIGQANAGFTAAVRHGVEQATGDYIAIHGSGDVSLSERIAKQAALLDAHPDAVVVGCAMERNGVLYRPAGWGKGIQPLRTTMLNENPLTHGEVMFRRSVYDAVGGYRPLFRFAQDRDLWLRMGRHGGYLIHPDVLYHRVNMSDGVSRSPEKIMLQKKFSAFAAYCALTVDDQGRDVLDRQGLAALLLMPRTRAVGAILFRLALGFLRRGDVARGREVLRFAADEFGGIGRYAIRSALPLLRSRSA